MKSGEGNAGDRVVRHTLSDGTIKEYRYPRLKRGRKVVPKSDTIAALIDEYQRSPRWSGLAKRTSTTYAIYLREFHRIGHIPVKDASRRYLLSMRNAIAESRGHGAAYSFIRTTSAMFQWAVSNGWIDVNPISHGVEELKINPLLAWTQKEADIAMSRLPEPLRRVVVLALYTGQRRGDLCRLPWAAYDGTKIRLIQQKTGQPIVIPCHPSLKVELEAWRTGPVVGVQNATILLNPNGMTWNPDRLSTVMPKAMKNIGLTRKLNVHGLRKLAAVNLAEAGCTTRQIMAVIGHKSLTEVERYTDAVDREHLADEAFVRLSNPGNKKTSR